MSAPRLSDHLAGPRDGQYCQNCSDYHALECWQECDDNGLPELRYVVVCANCANALIKQHPRFYKKIDLEDHPERRKRFKENLEKQRAIFEPLQKAGDVRARAKSLEEQKEEFREITPWLIGLVGFILIPIVMPVGVILLCGAVAKIAHSVGKRRK